MQVLRDWGLLTHKEVVNGSIKQCLISPAVSVKNLDQKPTVYIYSFVNSALQTKTLILYFNNYLE